MQRRALLLATPALVLARSLAASSGRPLYTASPGSGFISYGTALARFTAAHGIALEVRASAGSIENLRRVEDEPGSLATAFLGSVVDALTGARSVNGRRHRAIRALFPMYETGFMAVALASRGITRFGDLAGRKVGCGPAGGPGEVFFRAAAEAAGVSAEVVSGDANVLVQAVLAGEIDALWQGASVPIPAIAAVADAADAVVFGPGPATSAAVVARLPHLAVLAVPPASYRGQHQPITTIAAWNVVIANMALPHEDAYALTRLIATMTDPVRAIGPMAGGTRAANAGVNQVLTYHPGAARALREAGVTVPEIAPPA
jgi:hypothetical protein